jgi:hypothetical protein
LSANWAVPEAEPDVSRLRWSDLPEDLRHSLKGRLTGLWGAPSDEDSFDSLSVDKQQALLLIHSRMQAKDLWRLVKQITNLYGEGGVGIAFTPRAELAGTLASRKDFTRRLAKHRNTSGGFYERGRSEAALHFLYVDQSPPKWYVHFDLYSPVHSPVSAFKHFRLEYFRKVKPNWRVIQQRLRGKASAQE